MKDRFAFYAIVLASVYICLYMWNQKEEIVYLNEQIIKQEETILECRDLIRAQREYINMLERQGSTPFYKPTYPLNRGPI